MPFKCSVCLDSLQAPVSIPCGHVFCEDCLIAHLNSKPTTATQAACPTCRAKFNIDARSINTSIRRVYLDEGAPEVSRSRSMSSTNDRVAKLQKSLADLSAENTLLKQEHKKIIRRHHHDMEPFKELERKARTVIDQTTQERDEAVLEANALRERYDRLKQRHRKLQAQLPLTNETSPLETHAYMDTMMPRHLFIQSQFIEHNDCFPSPASDNHMEGVHGFHSSPWLNLIRSHFLGLHL